MGKERFAVLASWREASSWRGTVFIIGFLLAGVPAQAAHPVNESAGVVLPSGARHGGEVLLAAGNRLPAGGVWTHRQREGGETHIYRFTVGGARPASDQTAGTIIALAAVAAPLPDGAVSQKVGSAPPRAAAAVDIEADRAYLMTDAAGEGDEVTTPLVGQRVFLHLDYGVTGPGEMTLSTRALLDGESFCESAPTVDAGSWMTWCVRAWAATEGTHTLQWDLDYTEDLDEADEDNNSASTTFTTDAGGVDVEAERAFLTTEAGTGGDEVVTPEVGQTVFLHIDYRVAGPGDLDVTRRALLDGDSFCSASSTVHASLWVSWCPDGWVATNGTHTLQWDLDYTEDLDETDETNNSASTTWTTGEPSACTGDCDGSGGVGINELITMVNIALGSAESSACTAGDANSNGTIEINELITAVNKALAGCP